MKGLIGTILFGCMATMLLPLAAAAGPDEYIGDSAIYGGTTTSLSPNVLIILDTSGSMNDDILPGAPFEASTTYAPSSACGGSSCVENTVYKCTAFGLECGNWTAHVADVANVTTSCNGSNPYQSLTTAGQWNNSKKRLTTSGGCTGGNGIYATGNWINWREQVPEGGPVAKIQVAKDVLNDLVAHTEGANFGLMTYDSNGSAGGEFLEMDVAGTTYATTIKAMENIHAGTSSNRDALLSVISGIVASGWTPLAETLFEAMRYYKGEASAFGNSGTYLDALGKYVSPITGSCQYNYVVLMTDGMSTQDADNVLKTICTNGDCDGDGFEPAADGAKSYSNSGTDYLDDVAQYLFETDMSNTIDDVQNVVTYTIGFGLGGSNPGAVKLLKETAANGGGTDYYASGYADLMTAFQQILGKILEVDTSFVAPVVPTSPENRAYSGSRVYLGFFKPQTAANWLGNLKKFGLDATGGLVDSRGHAATHTDGGFKETALSFWSTAEDGGFVDSGGVGSRLAARSDLDPSLSTHRKIYSSLDPTEPDLTAVANRFDLAIAPDRLGLVATDTVGRDRLVNYIHGLDGFDGDQDGDRLDKRDWVMGDILHSKPLIVNYSPFTVDDLTDATDSHDESTCPSSWATDFTDCNKGVVFVGANDGMLHAFSDCNGEELWAFIPDNVLPNLNRLADTTHSYYLDATPVIFLYDKSKDGKIGAGPGAPSTDTGSSDRAILVFGQRRGGGQSDNLTVGASWGAYYALDVTNPAVPKLLWKIDRSTPGFGELGETWSDPVLGRVKVLEGGVEKDKIVAFVGAGYDNLNEDSRFGSNQSYGDTDVAPPTSDEGVVTSAGAVAASALTNNPKGRGIFAFEIATLDDYGVPTVASNPGLIWSFTPDTTAAINSHDAFNRGLLDYSIPSDIAAIDTDFDGYTDTLYVGDTGGQMWRISAHHTTGELRPYADSHIAKWFGKIVFSANPGAEMTPTNGRKIFYRPSVVLTPKYTALFFGTGDRAHPLNRAVDDRIYMVYDRGQRTNEHIKETSMEDLTLNLLQEPQISPPPVTCAAGDTSAFCVMQRLTSKTNYGWYIRMNDRPGEKALSQALVFSGVAYMTTFTSTSVTTDPCRPGSLGSSRLYVLDFKTGKAVVNYDPTNDGVQEDGTPDPVLRRSDRVKDIGVGIPSGVVVVLPKNGEGTILVGSGGGIASDDAGSSKTVWPLYWYQK